MFDMHSAFDCHVYFHLHVGDGNYLGHNNYIAPCHLKRNSVFERENMKNAELTQVHSEHQTLLYHLGDSV
jgi:hypothetical protein